MHTLGWFLKTNIFLGTMYFFHPNLQPFSLMEARWTHGPDREFLAVTRLTGRDRAGGAEEGAGGALPSRQPSLAPWGCWARRRPPHRSGPPPAPCGPISGAAWRPAPPPGPYRSRPGRSRSRSCSSGFRLRDPEERRPPPPARRVPSSPRTPRRQSAAAREAHPRA